jgi:hypothetical protein
MDRYSSNGDSGEQQRKTQICRECLSQSLAGLMLYRRRYGYSMRAHNPRVMVARIGITMVVLLQLSGYEGQALQ